MLTRIADITFWPRCDNERFVQESQEQAPEDVAHFFVEKSRLLWSLNEEVTIGLFGYATAYREMLFREKLSVWLGFGGLDPNKFPITNVTAQELGVLHTSNRATAIERFPTVEDSAKYRRRVYFSELTDRKIPSWSLIGTDDSTAGLRKSFEEQETNTSNATMVLRLIPQGPRDIPTGETQETVKSMVNRVFFHEMGHFLGFNHEHDSHESHVEGRPEDMDSFMWSAVCATHDFAYIYSSDE